jgi:hypothetical protein
MFCSFPVRTLLICTVFPVVNEYEEKDRMLIRIKGKKKEGIRCFSSHGGYRRKSLMGADVDRSSYCRVRPRRRPQLQSGGGRAHGRRRLIMS